MVVLLNHAARPSGFSFVQKVSPAVVIGHRIPRSNTIVSIPPSPRRSEATAPPKPLPMTIASASFSRFWALDRAAGTPTAAAVASEV